MLALICGNGYIVGINQIIDEDIDKVNKPFLPIAAGGHRSGGRCCLGTELGMSGFGGSFAFSSTEVRLAQEVAVHTGKHGPSMCRATGSRLSSQGRLGTYCPAANHGLHA